MDLKNLLLWKSTARIKRPFFRDKLPSVKIEGKEPEYCSLYE